VVHSQQTRQAQWQREQDIEQSILKSELAQMREAQATIDVLDKDVARVKAQLEETTSLVHLLLKRKPRTATASSKEDTKSTVLLDPESTQGSFYPAPTTYLNS
jgi:hypothetical protein